MVLEKCLLCKYNKNNKCVIGTDIWVDEMYDCPNFEEKIEPDKIWKTIEFMIFLIPLLLIFFFKKHKQEKK